MWSLITIYSTVYSIKCGAWSQYTLQSTASHMILILWQINYHISNGANILIFIYNTATDLTNHPDHSKAPVYVYSIIVGGGDSPKPISHPNLWAPPKTSGNTPTHPSHPPHSQQSSRILAGKAWEEAWFTGFPFRGGSCKFFVISS